MTFFSKCCCHRKFIPSVLLFCFLILGGFRYEIISAEKTFDVLPWSSEGCTELGAENRESFDLCAKLEFCEGDGNENGDEDYYHRDIRRFRRALQFRQLQNNPYIGSDYGDNYEEYGGKLDGPRPARYGYRVGSTPSLSSFSSDCTSPGPLIRVKRGKRYGLLFRNSGKADTVTNLHLHGLHIAGTGNADDVTRSVAGEGDTLIYNITIPLHHMGGTFFYHPHHQGSVQKQVSGGAFGMFIIEDEADDGDESGVGTSDPNVLDFLENERILIVDDIQSNMFTANGIAGSEGDAYNLYRDEWYRLRILMVNVDSHTSGEYVDFEGNCEVRALAHDGILRFLVPAAEMKSRYFLTSSSRLDVALKCSDSSAITAGGYSRLATLVVHDYDDEGESSTSVLGDPHPNASPFEEGSRQWASHRPAYLADMTTLPVDDRFAVDVYETSINNLNFNLDAPLCNHGKDFRYNTVNEWTLAGTVGHPFHVHVYPMQVLEGCGDEHDVGEFYDTITVKANYGHRYTRSKKKKCMVRLRFVDVGGHIMMHCHILEHEDHGAMAFLNVLGGPVQPSEPRVLQCGGRRGECDSVVRPRLCSTSDEGYDGEV